MMVGESTYTFFLGIGGVGMSGLAAFYLNKGSKVAGFDQKCTSVTGLLEDQGALVFYSEKDTLLWLEENWKQISECVFTPAISVKNAIYESVACKGIVIKKRAQVLGDLSKEYPCIAVSGTHGKTSTTAMIVEAFNYLDIPFIGFVGGFSKSGIGNFCFNKWGEAPVLVLEADEYDKSLQYIYADYAVVANMDPDHMDIYASYEEIVSAFNEFAKQVKKKVFIHDSLFDKFDEMDRSTPYGTVGDYVLVQDGVVVNGQLVAVDFPLNGAYNKTNALSAFVLVAQIVGDLSKVAKAIANFSGVERRYEIKVDRKDLVYIDDYAHHPVAIGHFLQSVRESYIGKDLRVIFQPHLYSRTKDFLQEFADALSLADEVILVPIYPARETPIEGVDHYALAKRMQTKVVCLNDLSEVMDCDFTLKGVWMTVGAGDIGDYVEQIKEKIEKVA